MKYYPICLDIRERKCLVVGGGRVAERKVKGLLDSGGRVTVVSPQLTDTLQKLREEGRLVWLTRGYRSGDADGFFLIIAATDDLAIQESVFAEAESKGIPVNVADVPEKCSFILPAQVKRGDLSIAVSTAGKSPALAKKIRRRLEKTFGNEYAILVEILGAIRPYILERGFPQAENERLFNDLLESDILDWIRSGQWDLVQTSLSEICSCPLSAAQWDGIKGKIGE